MSMQHRRQECLNSYSVDKATSLLVVVRTFWGVSCDLTLHPMPKTKCSYSDKRKLIMLHPILLRLVQKLPVIVFRGICMTHIGPHLGAYGTWMSSAVNKLVPMNKAGTTK